jgi:hypothetical protein
MHMLIAFFSWWYGRGWQQVAGSFRPRTQAVSDSFSVNQLLKTLFSPWRRIITPPGRSLEDKMRAMVDNMFSRVIGFFVRLLVLVGAVVTLLVVAIFTVVETFAWPLIPLAIPILIFLGVTQ